LRAAKADHGARTLRGADEFTQLPSGREIKNRESLRGNDELPHAVNVERGELCAELFQAQGAPFTLKIKLKAVGATLRGNTASVLP
jgi:hypothetical protein